MSLQSLYDLALGAPALRQRFVAARIKAAWDVLNEDAGTPSHTARREWAETVLAAPLAGVDREYLLFLANPTVQAGGNNATDNDIQFVVNGNVTAWATAV
jgi:glyoxylate utilization-related uncharacterized protein